VQCGEVWHEDFKAMVERVREVETIADETTWVTLRRYTSFKKKGERTRKPNEDEKQYGSHNHRGCQCSGCFDRQLHLAASSS
jgi:hypothetical protein